MKRMVVFGLVMVVLLLLISCNVGVVVDSSQTQKWSVDNQQEKSGDIEKSYYVEGGKYFCKDTDVEVTDIDFCGKLIPDLNRDFEDVGFTILLNYESSCDFENPTYKFKEYIHEDMRYMFCVRGIQEMAGYEKFKWYGSLQEGKLYQINTFFMNEGNQKLKIRYNRYIYDPDGILIDVENSLKFSILPSTAIGDDANLMSLEGIFYPEEGSLSYQSFGEWHDSLNKDVEVITIKPNALQYLPIDKKGDYTVQIIVYDLFTSKTIADEKTVISVK